MDQELRRTASKSTDLQMAVWQYLNSVCHSGALHDLPKETDDSKGEITCFNPVFMHSYVCARVGFQPNDAHNA